jgi:inorganic pyrophosphatase
LPTHPKKKIIAVHADDPEFKHFTDIGELPAHRLAEIRRFFEDYKKVVRVRVCVLWRWGGGGGVVRGFCAGRAGGVQRGPEPISRLATARAPNRKHHPAHQIQSNPNHHHHHPQTTTTTIKQNEHKEVKVDDILGATEAKRIIKDALNMYQDHYVPKKLRTQYA